VLDTIFSGYSDPGITPDAPSVVVIAGQRNNGTRMEYLLEASNAETMNQIYTIPGLEVTETMEPESSSVVVRVTDGRDIETVLRSADVRYR